mmetsp:Transcript_11658/g.17788  ORF Transcript_11658/g.17788 Transcript_11658/m.17788 type:complete len:206 (-) Transcript_11658:115-732(-)
MGRANAGVPLIIRHRLVARSTGRIVLVRREFRFLSMWLSSTTAHRNLPGASTPDFTSAGTSPYEHTTTRASAGGTSLPLASTCTSFFLRRRTAASRTGAAGTPTRCTRIPGTRIPPIPGKLRPAARGRLRSARISSAWMGEEAPSQWRNSCSQWNRVEEGVRTRTGHSSWYMDMEAMAWTVFPSPISSASSALPFRSATNSTPPL